LLFVGLVLSLLIAFPMMIGLQSALRGWHMLVFPLPFVAAFALGRTIMFIRARIHAHDDHARRIPAAMVELDRD
jgi:hypothetical protein